MEDKEPTLDDMEEEPTLEVKIAILERQVQMWINTRWEWEQVYAVNRRIGCGVEILESNKAEILNSQKRVDIYSAMVEELKKTLPKQDAK